MDVAVPVDCKIKVEKSGREEYLNLVREQNKSLTMKITVVAIITTANRTRRKRLVKKLKEGETGNRPDNMLGKSIRI